MVLVGPSGCGKSTLLRMIAGLEEVTAGSVRIDGSDVTDLAPRHRDVAMVFQSYALYPHMTVRDNMAYGLKVRRAPKAEIARRVDEVAGLLGLGELLDRRPAQLSGGQRQRVAMGRAIVREPKAFLMDEPLSNLDAKLRVSMRASLAQLHSRLGVTTIYVTHDQTEAMTLGRRVAVMRGGRIVQVDEPQQPLRRAARSLRRRLHRLAGDEPRRGDARRRRGRLRPVPDPARLEQRRPASGFRARRRSGSARRRSRMPPSRRAQLPQLDGRGRGRRGARLGGARLLPRRRCSDCRVGARDGDDDAVLLADGRAMLTARVDARSRARGWAPGSRWPSTPSRFHFFDPDTGESLARHRRRARRRARRAL